MRDQQPLSAEREALDKILTTELRTLREELSKVRRHPPGRESFERGATKALWAIAVGLILALIFGALAVDKRLSLMEVALDRNTEVIEAAHPRAP